MESQVQKEFEIRLLKALDDPLVQEKLLELIADRIEVEEYSECGGEITGWKLWVPIKYPRRDDDDSG